MKGDIQHVDMYMLSTDNDLLFSCFTFLVLNILVTWTAFLEA